MRSEFLIIIITGFLILNTYHDNKYTKMFKIGQKYMKMITIGFIGLSLILFFRKNPGESKNFLLHANDLIKSMPIDRNTSKLLLPLFNNSSDNPIQKMNAGVQRPPNNPNQYSTQKQQSNIQQSNDKVKRSVSETKKKFIASQQNWNCKHCKNQLDATFEVDHVIELQHGGDNSVNNLVALCRNCHGKKTMMTRLN
uniref:HNH nuclease domain-containing protein n=1 Tax=viral metagenome TaxID=1070528 RepID=A0A6C0KI21_9ZZZZ